MAGVRGRSGGSRPNTGGYRKGAGRKSTVSLKTVGLAGNHDSLQFLLDAVNDISLDIRLRVDAAKSILPYTHRKLGETGKKEDKNERAEKVCMGKFHAGLPPKVTPIR
jgi:phage terminase small subunit